jgi:hypothetical protein
MRAWWFPHCFSDGCCIASSCSFRTARIRPALQAPSAHPRPGALGSLYQNPLTLGVFFVLIGYYVYYYSFVLWKFKHVERNAAGAAPKIID